MSKANTKAVCPDDGNCYNADPSHWLETRHHLQDCALEKSTVSLSSFLGSSRGLLSTSSPESKGPGSQEVVPETPVSQQGKRESKTGGRASSPNGKHGAMLNGGPSSLGGANTTPEGTGARGAGAGGEAPAHRRDTVDSVADTPIVRTSKVGQKRKKKGGLLSDSDEEEQEEVTGKGQGEDVEMVSGKPSAPAAASKSEAGSKMIILDESDDDDDDAGWNTVGKSSPKAESPVLKQPQKRARKKVLVSSSEEEEEEMEEEMGEEVIVLDDTPKKSKKAPAKEEKKGTSDRGKKKKVSVESEDDEVESYDEESSGDDEDDEEASEDESGEDADEEVEQILQKCEAIGASLAESLGELLDSKNSGDTAIKQPSEMGSDTLVMKPYQLVGMSWMNLMHVNDVNGILADEMGLGKTIQSIAFLANLKDQEGVDGKHLIVTSASTLSNWKREFDTWFPSCKSLCYTGSQKERGVLRDKIRYDPDTYDVIITTYSMFQGEAGKLDRKFLNRIDFKVMILDEGHSIKDSESSRYKRLLQISTERRFMLTGTPINNNLSELLTLLTFLVPDLFSGDTLLDQVFNEKDEGHSRFVRRIKTILSTFVLRRRKKDVLGELTPKADVVHKLDMGDVQRRSYDGLVAAWKAEVQKGKAVQDEDDGKSSGGGGRGKGRAGAKSKQVGGAGAGGKKAYMSIFHDLKKAANHPMMIRTKTKESDLPEIAKVLHRGGFFGDAATYEQSLKEVSGYSDWDVHCAATEFPKRLPDHVFTQEEIANSAKLQKIAELLPELEAQGHRTLLFSQWTTILDIIEVFLEQRGTPFLRLDGSTSVSARQELIDTFQTDTSIPIFLLSTRAGGLGINLTAADTVILHDLDWNPQTDRQAEDRCHRIGQTKPVTVIKLVCKGTVDEHIYNMAESKRQLADSMLDEGGEDGAVEGGNDQGDQQMVIAEVLEGLLRGN